jgi:serine/threonine-protein kinase
VEGEVPYIVIELLEGEDLARHIEKHGKLSPEVAVDYVMQALEGVAAAHARGIVHRDLKPGNLFVSPTADGPQIKVLDFGISKLQDEAITRSMTGGESLIGTPAYMAPEQLREADRADERTDVWAMGVILYELLVGRRPYSAMSLIELVAELLHKAPIPIRTVDPTISPALAQVVERCLQKNPDLRYRHLGELADDLVRAVSQGAERAERINEMLVRSRPGAAAHD